MSNLQGVFHLSVYRLIFVQDLGEAIDVMATSRKRVKYDCWQIVFPFEQRVKGASASEQEKVQVEIDVVFHCWICLTLN